MHPVMHDKEDVRHVRKLPPQMQAPTTHSPVRNVEKETQAYERASPRKEPLALK